MPTIRLNGPLSQQRAAVASTKRYKALRWGRRTGKTEVAQYCAVMGHGEGWESSNDPETPPQFPGCMHGWHVLWVAPDFSQNDNLWLEIETIFKPAEPQVKVNRNARTVDFPGGGRLWCRSAEAIDAIRGAGKHLIGIVVEEAAHLDLQGILSGELLVTLMDNYDAGSWLVVISTSNSGFDGNAEHRVPSYFNILCSEILKGDRSEWYHEHGDARTNPKINPHAFDALLAEYKPGMERDRDEQLFALLLQGGLTQPFLDLWQPRVHVRVSPDRPPPDARLVAGLDWGYDHLGALHLFYVWHNGYKLRKHLRAELSFGRGSENGPMLATAVGEAAGALFQVHGRPEWIAYDQAMKAAKHHGAEVRSVLEDFRGGLHRSMGGDADPFRVPALVPSFGTEDSRRERKLLMIQSLTWEAGPHEGEPWRELQPWQEPELTIHPDCRAFIASVPFLTTDPKDTSKIFKDPQRDATNDFDAATYCLERVPPGFVEAVPVAFNPDHRHPGFDEHGRRKRGPRTLLDAMNRGAGQGARYVVDGSGDEGGDVEW